ncbi:hypothetical protein BI364_08925 [Acidihalobacter yilgarnensis]|uniref:Benzoate transporter n=1 Tax=Acidihalobacter yilgarnensis TaxID=2819280 RepID=A0A1D8INN6_9GAMM|nr:hypothetical protein BI364_08925 [Acidihalobacter yilgarnensis]
MPVSKHSSITLPAVSHVSAGFVAVLVGFASAVVIVIQAAQVTGANSTEIGSWILALGLGMGLTSIGLSLYYREPVLTAWSTPGAALLVTGLGGIGLSDATGAFLFSGLLIVLVGVSGVFERLMHHVPGSLASAMLAGILLQFGLQAFTAMHQDFSLVALMLLTYLVGKRLRPRYVIPLVLIVGLLYIAFSGQLHGHSVHLALARPVFTWPSFSLPVLISVGVPLFIVTMTSQNIPGLAVLRANGYQTPISPLLTVTGLATLILAPFGGFALNLSAITAAICLGEEAGAERNTRYLATVAGGFFYILIGLFGATIAALFAALPQAYVFALAGLALLGTIGNSLHGALNDAKDREAALVTFLVTASGLTLLGIGGAFWGLVARSGDSLRESLRG